jgi:hypothetical protein
VTSLHKLLVGTLLNILICLLLLIQLLLHSRRDLNVLLMRVVLDLVQKGLNRATLGWIDVLHGHLCQVGVSSVITVLCALIKVNDTCILVASVFLEQLLHSQVFVLICNCSQSTVILVVSGLFEHESNFSTVNLPIIASFHYVVGHVCGTTFSILICNLDGVGHG